MDTAVTLVQAYLRVNGYFTVTEVPIVASTRGGEYRTATDLDVLAFRFPGAGRLVPAPGRGGLEDEDHFEPDPALGAPAEQADMIVGEVKQGRAVLNAAATDPAVLRAAFVRFGCCTREQAPPLVEQLIREGHVLLPLGHRVRLVAFGAVRDGNGQRPYAVVTLGHIVAFLERHLRDHWKVLRHEDQKDPALGFLAMLEKSRRTDGALR